MAKNTKEGPLKGISRRDFVNGTLVGFAEGLLGALPVPLPFIYMTTAIYSSIYILLFCIAFDFVRLFEATVV